MIHLLKSDQDAKTVPMLARGHVSTRVKIRAKRAVVEHAKQDVENHVRIHVRPFVKVIVL